MSFVVDEAIATTSLGEILAGKVAIDNAWRPMFESVTGQTIEFEENHNTSHNTGVYTDEAPQRNPLQGLKLVSRDGGI